MQKNQGALVSLAGVSANRTKNIVQVLKNGTSFGPTLFNYKKNMEIHYCNNLATAFFFILETLTVTWIQNVW